MMNTQSQFGIHSTAGAVPIRNEKGEVSMQKVKVQRYVSGKRPDYAQYESSDDGSDDEDFIDAKRNFNKQKAKDAAVAKEVEIHETAQSDNEDEINDPRLRRLTARRREVEVTEERGERRRHIPAPEILEEGGDESESESEPETKRRVRHVSDSSNQSESEEELSDTEIERRRQMLREKLMAKKKVDEPEVLDKEEDKGSSSESSESEESYEDYTDSEEDTGPRLKPVFVSKRDRITLIEREKELAKIKQVEHESKKMAEERKRQTLRMVEDSIRKDLQKAKNTSNDPKLDDVCTDDENDEMEFETWKLRELKRIKRDREERDRIYLEKQEIERVRNLTDEERKQELRLNPKVVTNKAIKGKYKFLQKYYHRGAFYLDNEESVFKQDFSGATLDDHFDKTVLPKVMQVKNFGRSGRTKYTHLVDQDTTRFDSPWVTDTTQSVKFMNNHAAGMKQVFDKPTIKKNSN